MSKHTPEPWFYHRQGFSTVYIEARIGGGMLQEIAACGPCQDGTEQQDENARRIVACVNACRGLPTDELERNGLVAAVGPEQIRWISVKDGMPSNYDEVMIWPRPDFGYESFTGHFNPRADGLAYGSSGVAGWFSSCCERDGVSLIRVNVTHWMPMPMPEPPSND